MAKKKQKKKRVCERENSIVNVNCGENYKK